MANDAYVRLNGGILAIEGADAIAFAQAQAMSDVGALAGGDWQWSGWLSPKGRIVAFFALVRVSGESLLVWLPAGGAEALRERLARYVFRTKVKLTVRDDLAGIGTWASADSLTVPQSRGPSPVARLSLPARAGKPRTLLIVDAAAAPDVGEAVTASAADTDALARWQLADLRDGVPYIAAGASNSEQFVPQWLSLERLAAFSVKKGCYPGQEIVARMHFLGQSKRGAYVLSGEGTAPAPMARVLGTDGSSVGEVVWAVATGADWHALAALSVDKASHVASVEGAGHAAVVPPSAG